MFTVLRGALTAVLELALPRCCAGCQRADEEARPFCRSCMERLLGLLAQRNCPRCGSALGEGLPVGEDGCVACPTPMPRFDRLVRLGPYKDVLAESIRQFKFRRQTALAGRLGEMLAQRISAEPELADVQCLQPVPLHWWRRLQRGFNPADLLCRHLARRLDWPQVDSLVRTRNTPPQVRLPRTGRLENIRGAFAAVRPADIRGRHILLVDDVTTTGATADEATRALLAAGASRVSLAVLAKAELSAPFTPRHEGKAPVGLLE